MGKSRIYILLFAFIAVTAWGQEFRATLAGRKSRMATGSESTRSRAPSGSAAKVNNTNNVGFAPSIFLIKGAHTIKAE